MKPCRDLGMEHSMKQEQKCKGPEAGMFHFGLKNNKEFIQPGRLQQCEQMERSRR